MISIIICSRVKTISATLSKNIKDTIGCTYELIVIDNSENKFSIFEAYNLGVEKSLGDIMCFIHDDIIIHTEGWGQILLEVFNSDNKIGLVGIAGTKMKTKMPSAWWEGREDDNYICIIQHFKREVTETWNNGFNKNALEEVVAIDGVFMVLKKNTDVKFDKSMIGFHSYDLNLSFEVKRQNLKIVVTNQILIEHLSIGAINKDWFYSVYKIHKRYNNILPLRLDNSDDIYDLEIRNAERFIKHCLDDNLYKIAFLVWMKLFMMNPISKFNIKILIKFINKLYS